LAPLIHEEEMTLIEIAIIKDPVDSQHTCLCVVGFCGVGLCVVSLCVFVRERESLEIR